jgi:hypothetical protein
VLSRKRRLVFSEPGWVEIGVVEPDGIQQPVVAVVLRLLARRVVRDDQDRQPLGVEKPPALAALRHLGFDARLIGPRYFTGILGPNFSAVASMAPKRSISEPMPASVMGYRLRERISGLSAGRDMTLLNRCGSVGARRVWSLSS